MSCARAHEDFTDSGRTFTPIELLVVIAVIAILAALLLAFYCPPMEVWAVRDPDRGAWQVFIRSRKAEDRLRRDLLRAAERSEYNVSDH